MMLLRAFRRPVAPRFNSIVPYAVPTSAIPLSEIRESLLLAPQSSLVTATAPYRAASTSSSDAVSAKATVDSERPISDPVKFGLVSKWDENYYGRAGLPDPASSGNLLLTPGLLWAAAERDAAVSNEAPKEYLARVLDGAVTSMKAKKVDGLPRVINHDGTLAALRTLGREAGEGLLLLLTGPRSVGKSLMLQKMAKELAKQKRRVLYIDARQYGTDITRGMVSALAAEPSLLKEVLALLPKASAASVIAMVASLLTPLGADAMLVAQLVEKYLDKKEVKSNETAPPRLDVVLGTFIKACTARGEYPVVFIDEANKAFKAAGGDVNAAARVLDELDLLTRVTKQEKEASVVLATSEHGLPFRLRALGYNTNHISKTIVAEEVPPAVMKRELMSNWGCGEHLATALLSMYGGHVLHASAAVRELATSAVPESMKGIAAAGSISSAPAHCLGPTTLAAAGVAPVEWEAMRKRVTKALRELVVKGSLPLDSDEDKVAEIISVANAGCVIPLDGTSAGVPPEAWQARAPSRKLPKHTLVPSSHMMRLLIASEVFPHK